MIGAPPDDGCKARMIVSARYPEASVPTNRYDSKRASSMGSPNAATLNGGVSGIDYI